MLAGRGGKRRRRLQAIDGRAKHDTIFGEDGEIGNPELEADLKSLGVSYCILRPTVLFGKEDVLINNIAWSLRHLPVIGVFGSGDYRLQPIYVDDLAQAAAEKVGGDRDEVLEAIGPETFTYRELVARVGSTLGVRRPIISVPPGLGDWGCRLVGLFVGDVVITREEIRGLMEGRLYPGRAFTTQ